MHALRSIEDNTNLNLLFQLKPRLSIFTTISCIVLAYVRHSNFLLKTGVPGKNHTLTATKGKKVFHGSRSTRIIPKSSVTRKKFISKSTKRSTNLLTGTICTLYAMDTICTQYVILHKKNYASFST